MTRKRVLQIVAAGGAAGLALKLGWGVRPRSITVRRSRVLMGTVVDIAVIGDERGACEIAIEAALKRMTELERLLSRHRDDSEVGRLGFGLKPSDDDPVLRVVPNRGQIVAFSVVGLFFLVSGLDGLLRWPEGFLFAAGLGYGSGMDLEQWAKITSLVCRIALGLVIFARSSRLAAWWQEIQQQTLRPAEA